MKYSNASVSRKFSSYPKDVRTKLEYLRSLIMQVASEEGVEDIEETLKWGEPSYIAKSGSTIRIDWKKASPDRYSMYFNCKTKLLSTFKEIYPDSFSYSGNQEIYFKMNESLPTKELKHCIYLSLKYHEVKQLPLLGA